MKDKKKQAILVYIVLQTLFLWIFINFPLQPFPGKVYVKEGAAMSQYDADISFGQYLYPDKINTTENIEKIEFKPIGWLLLVLIVFLTPILIAFRWSVSQRKRPSDSDDSELKT